MHPLRCEIGEGRSGTSLPETPGGREVALDLEGSINHQREVDSSDTHLVDSVDGVGIPWQIVYSAPLLD